VLPTEHKVFLRQSNGVEIYGGYFRLFGLTSSRAYDLARWNEPECWKFAWDNKCTNFVCFGETAWGDQYAYGISSLAHEREAAVYFLSAFSMTAEVIAPSFGTFLNGEFRRCANDPYDEMIKAARRKLGRLDPADHLVYVPSMLLGGVENIRNVQRMNARAAMICNGDIAMQVDGMPPGAVIGSVQLYEDHLGRTRARLVLA
jgi:hypothetical protein